MHETIQTNEKKNKKKTLQFSTHCTVWPILNRNTEYSAIDYSSADMSLETIFYAQAFMPYTLCYPLFWSYRNVEPVQVFMLLGCSIYEWTLLYSTQRLSDARWYAFKHAFKNTLQAVCKDAHKFGLL